MAKSSPSPQDTPATYGDATATSFKKEGAWNQSSVTTVELSIACWNLTDAKIFSKIDPMVVMYTHGVGIKDWKEHERTETIKNTPNPNFVKKFVIDYFFEEIQALRFDVYGKESKGALSENDLLGQIHCTLGELVESRGKKYESHLRIEDSKGKGKMIISVEELDSSKDVVIMKWEGKKLDKKDFFGKSDPFMVFWRCNKDKSFTVCHKTEVIKNTLNPTWKQMEIPVQTLCNGDLDRTIKIEVHDWNRNGTHDLIGIFSTRLSRLMSGPCPGNIYECINPDKKKEEGYKHSGFINLVNLQIQKQATFLDYIRGGMELNFVFAIDFSASNGNPLKSNSFHSINSSQPNQYELAIQAVGEIVQDRASDKRFPVFGFGARLPHNDKVSDRFALNFTPQNPFCVGIEEVLESYKSCIRKIHPDEPTNFSPIIKSVSEMASKAKNASEYFVLLIITDGVISDMSATREAIVNAARLPMSIIIVGVGKDKFEAMEELDGDTVRLSHKGVEAERDIVQFVPFRNYGPDTNIRVFSQTRLAKEVLAEIPDQVVGYMKKRNLKPDSTPPRDSRTNSLKS